MAALCAVNEVCVAIPQAWHGRRRYACVTALPRRSHVVGSAPGCAPLSPVSCDNGGVTQPADPAAEEMPDLRSWRLPRLLLAWGVAFAVGVIVTVLVPDEQRFAWLAFAVGLSTLVTFALQLGTAQSTGFITRTSFSIAGSVVIIAVIDVVALLLHPVT